MNILILALKIYNIIITPINQKSINENTKSRINTLLPARVHIKLTGTTAKLNHVQALPFATQQR
jgi:hypothetical protein